MHSAKKSAQELIDRLPDSIDWNGLMYELYVKQKIDEGLRELDEGQVVDHETVRRQLLGEWAGCSCNGRRAPCAN